MTFFQKLLSKLKVDRRGVTALEYGLVAAVIGAGLIASMGTLKNNLANSFGTIGTKISTASK